ncbi:MAG: AAA family ATPase [Bacteroidia bacterium]|nr:AAA family ATPase [Bacteroidia bacterium]
MPKHVLMSKFPIGISDFKQVREGRFYYVDKSLLIKEIIDDTQTLLLPRPRRFGKRLTSLCFDTF